MRRTMAFLASTVSVTLLLAATGVAAEDDDPGAGTSEVMAVPYAAVSGSARGVRAGGVDIEVSETVPEVIASGHYAVVTFEMDDPRLSGRWEGIQNIYQFVRDDPGAVRAGTARLVNDGGTWSVTFTGFTPPGARDGLSANRYHMLFSGEEGYGGLSAIIVVDPVGPAVWELDGVLFPGPMPEYPALPTD